MGAKAVYRKHYLCLRRYGSAYKRALRIWTKLLGWSQTNFPALATSILPGGAPGQAPTFLCFFWVSSNLETDVLVTHQD